MADRTATPAHNNLFLHILFCLQKRTKLGYFYRITSTLLILTGTVLVVIFYPRPAHEKPYYVLSIQWPPTLCNSNQKCKPDVSVNQWLIHGLWPQYQQQPNVSNQTFNFLQYCRKDSPFVLEKIESLRSQLHVDWTNLLQGKTDQTFWTREWEKHGTCSPFDQYDYFDKTVTLFRQFSVDRFLANERILPNPDTQYRMEQFQQALIPLMESEENFSFQCSKRKGGKLLVQEIRLCFRLNATRPETGGFSPTKCSLTKSNCGSSFLFIN